MLEYENLWPTEKVSLCANCAKHLEIKALVESDLAEGVCGVCGSDDNKVFRPSNFNKMRDLIRALVRFHFNEDQYNGHWGGTSISNILLDEQNPLLETACSTDYSDDFVARIEEEGGVYPKYDEGICLYAGNDETGRLIQFSIQETICSLLRDIELRLNRENFHLVEPAMKKLLSRIEADLDFWIEEGENWFRSRTGVKEQSLHIGFNDITRIAVPFKSDEIGALLPPAANAGRTNRQCVSVLYLGSDMATAMSEIRPHPGHLISVGGFRAKKRLRVASFDQPISNFCSSDKRLDDFAVIHHIDSLLQQPVIPEERHRYAATQLLSDILMRNGFDGIAFGSSVGSGKNLCVFDPTQFDFDESQSCVKHVDELQYKFSDVAMTAISSM